MPGQSQDPWEEAAKEFKAQQQPSTAPNAVVPGSQNSGTPQPNEDWKLWQASSLPVGTAPQQSTAQKVGSTALDLTKGAGEGFLNTAMGATSMDPVHRAIDWGMRKISPAYGQEEDAANAKLHNLATPANTAQKIGRGVEQAAEFMAPGLGEEGIAAKAPGLLKPLARIAVNSLGSGVIDKAQGGSFGAGAAGGAVGGAASEGLRALAPKIAESAIGIRGSDRGFGKTPGKAIIEDTRGVRPATVAKSAQEKIDDLTPQLESLYTASPNRVSLAPARNVVDSAIKGANSADRIEQLQPFAKHLATDPHTGLPLAPNQTPMGALKVKRGLSDVTNLWNRNPMTVPGVVRTGRSAYRALDDELDKAVPEGEELNQRISSLLPVTHRAEISGHNAELPQRVLHRMAAHTGALTGAATGGYAGYREGGLTGGILGGLTGLVVPEVIASPTANMAIARGFASPFTHRILRPLGQGIALESTR